MNFFSCFYFFPFSIFLLYFFFYFRTSLFFELKLNQFSFDSDLIESLWFHFIQKGQEKRQHQRGEEGSTTQQEGGSESSTTQKEEGSESSTIHKARGKKQHHQEGGGTGRSTTSSLHIIQLHLTLPDFTVIEFNLGTFRSFLFIQMKRNRSNPQKGGGERQHHPKEVGGRQHHQRKEGGNNTQQGRRWTTQKDLPTTQPPAGDKSPKTESPKKNTSQEKKSAKSKLNPCSRMPLFDKFYPFTL